MPVPITMPQLGESVTEGTVTRWLKDVGDFVALDEPLLEVSTDKVDTEILAPTAGILLEIKAVEDDVVEVGGLLALVGVSTDQPAAIAQTPTSPAPAATEGTPVVLPPLGESVSEGTVTRWLKEVGEPVSVGEALLEVSTDKVDTEIPSPVGGMLAKIVVAEDETVLVGSTLAVISTAVPTPQTGPAPGSEPEPPVSPVAVPAAPAPANEPYASPIVRKLAHEARIDLSTVAASGAGGRVTKADVLAAVDQPPPAIIETPQPTAAKSTATAKSTMRGHTEPMTRLRRVIAERMVESLQISAQLTTVVEIDVTKIATLRLRARAVFKDREGVSLSFLPFFARAGLEALKAHPSLNSSVDIENSTVTFHDSVHLAIAVDTDRGLLVPVIRNADDLTLAGLARRIADVAEQTRNAKVGPDDLSGGTFTLTNTGSVGALFDTPIINQPQVAILATGTVVKRPVVMTGAGGEDVIAIRSMVYFALTYDHRVVDGADAARFLGAVKTRLEAGEFEAELGL